MDDSVVFAPLTNKVTANNKNVAKNFDVLFILNKDFRESLTLRSLVLLCEACCMRPTAPMLAFALQNSIPGLVGLPMDNPDIGYYIDIAQKFFDPTEVTFEEKVAKCIILRVKIGFSRCTLIWMPLFVIGHVLLITTSECRCVVG